MRIRVAEIDENAISDVAGDEPLITSQHGDTSLAVGGDDVADIFGIEPFRKRRRPHEVAEHHGQLPPFSAGRDAGGSTAIDHKSAAGAVVESRDRALESPAVPDGQAKLCQIGFGEIGNDIQVDALPLEQADILAKANTLEPVFQTALDFNAWFFLSHYQ